MLDFATSLGLGLLTVWPVWRIFQRVGIAPPFALLVFLGFPGLLICATMLAFGRWPTLDGPPPGEPGTPAGGTGGAP